MWRGSGPGQEAAEVLGDDPGVVRLGVVGGAADVGSEHDVVHRRQGVVGGEELALEVVEAGGRHLARREGRHQRVGVVEGGPRPS